MKQNYKDFLNVSVEDVKNAGYEEKYPRRGRGMVYYVCDIREYVLASTSEGYRIILDKETYENIGYKSIYVCYKEYYNDESSPIPYICNGAKCVKLHRDVMNAPKGVQIDHINHNQSCCIKENLRRCNNKQNTMNRQDKCSIYGISDTNGLSGYRYDLAVDVYENDKIILIGDMGFEEVKRTSKEVIFRSPVFQSKVDGMLSYRDNKRLLLKGTGMEKFVYDIENDFRETIDLLIRYYILGDITKEEMHQMNLEHWRNKLDNAPNLK